jgi:hypothetical protein
LGSAVNIVDPLKVHDTTLLHDLTLISPWTPIAVTRTEAPGFEALLGAWRADPRLARIVVLKADSIIAPHAALHATLRAAAPPAAESVARWIHLRTGSTLLADAILDELIEGEALHRTTRHGRFRKAGPLTATGWQDLFLLTQILSHTSDASVDAIAGAVDRDVRTLREIPKRRLGMTFTLARTGFGWRWAIEHILRQHGYLEEEDPVSLAVGLLSGRIADHAWSLRNKREGLLGNAGGQLDA